ncbi:MAG TPA: helix-turn-helix transcriptional regulator, partial [Polyangiaceae bacterium]
LARRPTECRLLKMRHAPSSTAFQSFLPSLEPARAHVWKFSWEYGGRRPRHFHAEPELNLIVAGSARFGVGNSTLSVTAGELLGFAPGQDHVLLDASPEFYLFAIGMAPTFSAEVLRSMRAPGSTALHVRLSTSDFKALTTRAETIVDRSGIDQQGAELWEHAHGVLRGSAQYARMHVLTRRALQLIGEDPELDRDILAHKLRTNPTTLSRYFHHDLGMTLVQYRTRQRLMRLIELLDHGKGNLANAAKAAGFGSYSQCHRVFAAELGCSPRDFFYSELRQRMQMAYEP